MAAISAQELFEQYKTLDDEAREEFLRLLEAEDRLNAAGEFVLTAKQQADIDRSLADLEAGRVVSGDDILGMLRHG